MVQRKTKNHKEREMVMENENGNVVVNTRQVKSNAPWILGIVGFVASIPNILCATICAAAVATYSEDSYYPGQTLSSTSQTMGWLLLLIIVASIACFVLSFFGKSKQSVITGIVMIAGSVFILINGFVGLGSFIWGSVAGVCYLIGGIFSILNSKRIA